MRIPTSINTNIIKTYEPPGNVISKSTSRFLQSYNFEKWDEQLPKSLRENCIDIIAQNWEDYPILDELSLSSDRYHLVDILSTDLPLKLTIPKIDDDIYWKRCYLQRWPKNLPHLVKDVEIFEIVKCSDTRKTSSVYSIKENDSIRRSSKISLQEKYSRKNSKVSSGNRSDTDSSYGIIKSWKEHYIEMHVRGYLEHLRPENYDAEKLKELFDLCAPYVSLLRMDQMQCSDSPPHRIPISSILAGLQSLKELSLCFKQTYVGEDFSWNVVRTSQQDIKLLIKGLEKLRLQVLRIQNSDITGDKATAILKAVLKHDLDVLDFSHCKISNEGALAVAKFVLEVPVTEIILTNNKIGIKGIKALSYSLLQEPCRIKKIDLRLNHFGDEGGQYLLSALEEHGKTIKYLVMIGCGLTKNISFEKILFKNNTIEILDISNNRIGEYVGQEILEALKYNIAIKRFDLRMCQVSSETEFSIQELINENRKGRRKIPKTPFFDDGQKLDVNYEDIELELSTIFRS